MTNQKPKILVCVPFPNGGEIEPQCVKSLSALKACTDMDVEINEVQGATISVLRNAGINGGGDHRLYQSGFVFDYYMAIDSDIEFTVDDVRKLVAGDKPVISGFYQYRMDKGYGVAGMIPEEVRGTRNRPINSGDFLRWDDTGIKQVDWVGAGFLLVKREVLEDMQYPWFRDGLIEYEKDGNKCQSWYGEDVGFCFGAQKAGYKIYCDCDTKVNHIIIKPFTKGRNMKAFMIGRIGALQAELDGLNKAIAGRQSDIAQAHEDINRLRDAALEKRGAILAFGEALELAKAQMPAAETVPEACTPEEGEEKG